MKSLNCWNNIFAKELNHIFPLFGTNTFVIASENIWMRWKLFKSEHWTRMRFNYEALGHNSPMNCTLSFLLLKGAHKMYRLNLADAVLDFHSQYHCLLFKWHNSPYSKIVADAEKVSAVGRRKSCNFMNICSNPTTFHGTLFCRTSSAYICWLNKI